MKKVILIIMLHFSYLYSNNDTIRKNIKVGLVLSGGGAKGLAHIGAIRELEKLGITPDYISGTSMGAIVGGLYACGYNSYEIEEIMKENNFLDIIQDQLKYKRYPFFRKQQSDYMLGLEINDNSLTIPAGISKGILFFNFYAKYTSKFHEVEDFSKLPIPFVCVATNLEKGVPVYLENGLLPLAVRASGSYPGLSKPIFINGEILIDGGISNNYPAKILKDKGMDYVIGVNVEKNLRTKEELNSVSAIIDQLVSFGISNSSIIQKQYVNIELKPEVSKKGILDFDDINYMISEGRLSVLVKEKELLYLKARLDSNSLQINNLPKLHDSIGMALMLKNISTMFFIKNIEIYGNKNYTNNYIRQKIRLYENESYTMDEINEGIERVQATENFDEFYYQNRISDSSLIFHVKEKENDSKLNISLLHYDDINGLSIPINSTLRNILFKNSIWSNTLVFASGRNLKFKAEYFVDNGLSPSFGANFGVNIMNSRTSNFTYFSDFLGMSNNSGSYFFKYNYMYSNIYVKSIFREYFSLCVGMELLKADIKTDIASTISNENIIKEDQNTYGSLYGNILLNNLDDKYMPMSGNYIFGEYRMIFLNVADYGSSIMKINTINIFPLYRNKISFFLETHLGLRLINDNPLGGVWDFLAGGQNNSLNRNLLPFAGYNSFDLPSENILMLSTGLKLKLSQNHYISPGVSLILGSLNSKVYDPKSGLSLNYTYFNNFIGPLNVSIGYDPYINKKLISNFNLGFIVKLD